MTPVVDVAIGQRAPVAPSILFHATQRPGISGAIGLRGGGMCLETDRVLPHDRTRAADRLGAFRPLPR